MTDPVWAMGLVQGNGGKLGNPAWLCSGMPTDMYHCRRESPFLASTLRNFCYSYHHAPELPRAEHKFWDT